MKLIAVVTCSKPAFIEKADAQRQTWATLPLPPDTDIHWFTGQELGVDDSYEALPQKVQAISRFAFEHGYNSLLKIDDDVWLTPAILNDLPPADYCGNVRTNLGVTYASGFGYQLSRRGMEAIAAAPLTDDTFEDKWTGAALARAGIRPVNASHLFRIISPGIPDPRLIWANWSSSIGHSLVFGQFDPKTMHRTMDAYQRFAARYFKSHPSPNLS